MRFLLAVSLILSTPGLATADPATLRSTAPGLPTMPPGLELAVDGPDGTQVPPDIAKAVDELLEDCKRLPARCQARLDRQWGICDAMVSGARLVERADCLGARVEAGDGGGITPWQALVGGVVIAVLSGGAMYLAGRQDR